MKSFCAILLFLLSFSVFSSQSFKESLINQLQSTHTKPLTDYAQARRYLFGDLYLTKDNTIYDVYCHHTFTSKDGVGPNKIPNPEIANCEHTWPQSKFTNEFPKEIQKNDLHHLFPVYSKGNSARSNYPFGTTINNKMEISNCESSRKGTLHETNSLGWEPPAEHKGNVARAMFYFSLRYHLKIDDKQEDTFREWSKLDPVDQEERSINLRIKDIQGNSNIFIEHPEYIDQVEDF